MDINISEPLPNSKPGYQTTHDFTITGKSIGHINVEYTTEEDIQAFKKAKRKPKIGQPFKAIIYIDVSKTGIKANELGKESLKEIATAIKNRFQGLEDRDIGIIELYEERKNIIGCISSLQTEERKV